MRYISLLIGGIVALSACNNVKVDSNGAYEDGVLTAGFQDTTITVFENEGTQTLEIELSRVVSGDTKVILEVCEENNIRENENYLIPAKELTVKAGEKSVKVEYSLVDDHVVNGERKFSLQLLSVNGGIINSLRAKVQIIVLDDESDVAIGFKSTEVSCRERKTGSSASSYLFQLPVELLGKYTKPIQYKVALYPVDSENAAVEGTHFRLPENTFMISNEEDELSIPIEIIDDSEINPDRLFAIEISEVNGGKIYTTRKRCIVTIANDDLGIYFSQPTIAVEERAGRIKIPVKTMGISEEDVHIRFQLEGDAVEGTDYSFSTVETVLLAGQDSVEVAIDILYPEVKVSPDRTLRLRLGNVTGAQVFGDGICDVRILDCDSKVSFEEEKVMVSNDSTQMSLPITLSGALEHDVTFRVNVGSLTGMNESQVTVITPQVTIPAGTTVGNAEFALKKLSVKSKANFKVEIDRVYGASSESSCTVNKVYVYQTSDLAIADFSSEEPAEGANGGTAAHAIDGNTQTYWHDTWAGGTSVLPEGLVLKLPSNLRIMAIEVTRRVHSSNKDLKTLKLYLSNTTTKFLREDDGTAWGASIGTLSYVNQAKDDVAFNTRRLTLDEPLTGNYLKLEATESWRSPFVSISEINIYGYTE